ncbi:hypothetical protein SK854_27355 [Lentzea sp. BCCO 10_0061]|uniref:Uncharacterized protein n=1 Tax=Lentzea sokolovensis TaxID=3095429 RepID=A0ABU4V2C1_9PSEU|nr:hypothetical protein [Lentzea sp. BCCO 10_0061]MDX8145854.1 hypothetical protein [Lentzea sp. BCCO 10_0061]
MIFAEPLGPGHVARQQVCRAGEALVWAMYRRTFYYAVDGLDQLGAPGRSLFARGASAVGRGVGDFALTALGGGGDSGDDKAPAADHLVFGPSAGSLAASAMARFEPGKRVDRLWALTSTRLVVAERHVEPVVAPEKSFLGKAIGFGREVGKILADNRRKYGEHVEGEPVAVPDYRIVCEFPRAQIASVSHDRVTFVDGSGFEFLLENPAVADDEVVVSELTKFWLRPGERLVLGLPPIVGHVGGVVGGEVRLPLVASSPMPALELDGQRWPLPAPPSPQDWTDDPTLGYWVDAPAASCLAVSLADHFAFSRGNARLAVSDQRVAVVYPTRLFEAKPSSVFTTFAEIPSSAVRSLETPCTGASLPARPIVRLTFADGSALALRRQS